MKMSDRPWTSYIYSPDTRSPNARSVFQTLGKCQIEQDDNGPVLQLWEGSMVVLDFGVEVGGHLTFEIMAEPGCATPVALAFSESSLFVGANSDDTGAVPTMDYDKAYTIDLGERPDAGWMSYRMPEDKLRGGFRYATFIAQSKSNVQIKNIRCEISFAPDQADLRDYSGYFHCNDGMLNRIWYAGAYTVQTNIIPNHTGRHLPQVKPGWKYSAKLGEGSPILVDGAKRDRAIWPGDMGISIPSCLLAFGPSNGWPAVKNALKTVFHHQHPDGQLLFAGPATMSFNNGSRSLTYHFWSLVACVDLYDWGGDQAAFVKENWGALKKALDFSMNAISPNGVIEQTQLNDWGRDGSGGYNAALNALAYRSLDGMASIAQHLDPAIASTCTTAAQKVQKAFNELLWDHEVSLYRDNTTSDVHPQDGNALALAYGVAPPSRAKAVSAALAKNWNDIGPVCPELEDTISPFISSIEVMAHFVAGEPERAVELMRRTWGYILDAPHMTGSTLVEGMTANGSLHYRAKAGYNDDPSYISLSHSWSSGPTSSLIYHLLGLSVTSGSTDAGARLTWSLRPNVGTGKITNVQGGFETSEGRFEASWTVNSEMREWRARISAPAGTSGTVGIPRVWGEVSSVTVDGEKKVANPGPTWYEVSSLSGGDHEIFAQF